MYVPNPGSLNLYKSLRIIIDNFGGLLKNGNKEKK